MTIYLGNPGILVPLYTTPTAQLEIEDRYSFDTTLEGKRIAQARPVGRRSWSINAQFADPSEQSTLQQFVNGEWGHGPFTFVSVDAPVTNLLSPAASTCDPAEIVAGAGAVISGSGPVQTDGGWSGRSYVNTGTGAIYFGRDKIPVLPGKPVTVAVYVKGVGSTVAVSFYNSAGTLIGSPWPSLVTGNLATWTRSFVTVVAPANAATCTVSAWNTTHAVRPSITWTANLLDWAAGEGCPRAVVHGASKTVLLASSKPRGNRYSNLSYTVTEVG